MKRFAIALAAALMLVPALAQAAVTVKGSDTMVILAQRWAEIYMQKNGGKKVQVTGGGSGTGIAALVNGTTDANARARRRARAGQVWSGTCCRRSAAKDGLAVYPEANGVNQLTWPSSSRYRAT
jgi:phosphate transport system substrate-binding protein